MMRPNIASAIRSPETAHRDQVAQRAEDGWTRFAVNLKNLVQLCVQVGEVSKSPTPTPQVDGERVLPYCGRLAIKRGSARGERG
jgi:hypothetical protein